MTGAERHVRVGGEPVSVEERWEADFSPSADWLIERQEPDSEVTFAGDSMRIDCLGEGGVTVWTRQEFPADVLVEYRATCAEPEGETSSRNLNCFFCAREEPGQPLDATERSGAYPEYHGFPNYVFTLTRSHTRLRRDPGFEMKSELMLGSQPNVAYTVRLLKRGGDVVADVNGRTLHEWTDPDPHGSGWIGMRTYESDVTYDRWAVYGIE